MSVENVQMLRIIIICVAVAIEVFLAIFAILSIRKDKKLRMGGGSPVSVNPLQGQPPVQNMQQAAGNQPSFQQPLKPGSAQSNVMNQAQQMQFARENEKKWYLKGVDGFFTGQVFPIEDKLVIGRNSQKCQVAFPVDHKGISGAHCELSVTAQGVFLKDCGSSYGTFSEAKIQLVANQPVAVPEGSRFYLADPKEMFQIVCM